MPKIPYYAALYLAVIQFLFATTWTIYVIFLPQLLAQAGIDAQWLGKILLLDQLIFIVMDISLGFAADKVRRIIGNFGGLIVGTSVISCVAFIAMPWAASAWGATGLLSLIFIWVFTSSALRVPPMVMLGQYAAKPQLPLAVALQAVGLAVAGSIAPYLGMVLANTDPRLPFVLNSVTLMLTVLGLIYVERILRQQINPAAVEIPRLQKTPTALLILSSLFAGVGFQIYASFNVQPQLLQFASKEQLPYLMPVFWMGFNLLVFPVSLLVKRVGVLPMLSAVGVLTTLSAVFATWAGSLEQLLIAQFLMGGFWGGVFTVGITAALFFGSTGREGIILGLWFSMLSAAAFLRIGLLLSGESNSPAIKSWLPTAPIVLWACASLLFMLVWLTYKRAEGFKTA